MIQFVQVLRLSDLKSKYLCEVSPPTAATWLSGSPASFGVRSYGIKLIPRPKSRLRGWSYHFVILLAQATRVWGESELPIARKDLSDGRRPAFGEAESAERFWYFFRKKVHKICLLSKVR